MPDNLDIFDLAFGEAIGEQEKKEEEPAAGDTTQTQTQENQTQETQQQETQTQQQEAQTQTQETQTQQQETQTQTQETQPQQQETQTQQQETQTQTQESPAVAELQAELQRLREEIAQAKTPEKTEPTAAEKKQQEDMETARAKAEAEWADFKKNWEEPAAMMEKMYQGIMNQVDFRIQQAIQQALGPISKTVADTQEDRLKVAIEQVHAGGVALIETGVLEGWIKTLPTWKQGAAREVIKSGTAQDINDLITEYKVATGTTTTQTTPTAEEMAAEEAKKKRMKAMEAVGDRRTTVTGSPDPNDYDGAFKQAIANG